MLLTPARAEIKQDALTFKVRDGLLGFFFHLFLSLKELPDGLTGKVELHL